LNVDEEGVDHLTNKEQVNAFNSIGVTVTFDTFGDEMKLAKERKKGEKGGDNERKGQDEWHYYDDESEGDAALGRRTKTKTNK